MKRFANEEFGESRGRQEQRAETCVEDDEEARIGEDASEVCEGGEEGDGDREGGDEIDHFVEEASFVFVGFEEGGDNEPDQCDTDEGTQGWTFWNSRFDV